MELFPTLSSISLTQAERWRSYKIVKIVSTAPRRIDRLTVMGITPGSEICLLQRRPSYVIRVGETDIALDRDIVKDIYIVSDSISEEVAT